MLVELGRWGGWWLLHCGNGGRKVLAVCSGLGRERIRRSGRLPYHTVVNIVKHAANLLHFYRIQLNGVGIICISFALRFAAKIT